MIVVTKAEDFCRQCYKPAVCGTQKLNILLSMKTFQYQTCWKPFAVEDNNHSVYGDRRQKPWRLTASKKSLFPCITCDENKDDCRRRQVVFCTLHAEL